MKKAIQIAFFALIVIPLQLGHTEPSDTTAITQRLTRLLPSDWYIAEIRANIKPYWSFSEDTCLQLTIAGPRKTGYKYLDGEGNLILKSSWQREALILWIGDGDFDPNWSILKRIRNRLSKVYSPFPTLVHEGQTKLYGLESLYGAEKEKTPLGTRTAIHIEVTRSWPSWRKDLMNGLKREIGGETE